MARDYAKTRSGKGRRRRPAARPKRSGPPGWVWLFCGLCLGLAIAAGVYIFGRPAGNVGAAGPAEPPAKTRGAEGTEAAADTEPRFSFYEMLPNYEIVIPEEEYTREAGPDEQKTTPKVRQPGQYVIQAGSFSNHEDADRRKAGLALLGVESHIEQVELKTGRTVYRVRTGPVSDVDRLNDTLERLRENGIDTLVMRSTQ